MLNDDLFTSSWPLNSDLYRNVAKAPDKPFDDLAEDDDSFDLAETAINQAQSALAMGRELLRDPVYYNAIGRSFENRPSFPTRYSDGTYPVWYGSLAENTTIFETAYWMIRIEMAHGGTDRRITRQRQIFRVHCDAILVDLREKKERFPELVGGDYHLTHQIGRRIQREMHPGLLAPSARDIGGINAAIFTSRVLSNPRPDQQLQYQLDPATLTVTVASRSADASGNAPGVNTVNGSVWF